jgi:uncharacterized protein YecE (DUF72 family)
MNTGAVRVGTSGFAFKEWKGPFYPADLKDDAMLEYYSGCYPTVEINNTFYRLPKEHVLEGWAAQVPEPFSFAIKASQRITHFARLRPQAATAVAFLLRNAATLGERLGPILFQLPPNLRKDLQLLQAFLALLPSGRRFTIEFRHESWFDEDVFAELRSHDIALCVAEAEDLDVRCPNVATASWGYMRLHRQDYDDTMLAEWRERVMQTSWSDAYVFFKHDYIDGAGPLAVDRFTAMINAGRGVGAAEAVLPRANSRESLVGR